MQSSNDEDPNTVASNAAGGDASRDLQAENAALREQIRLSEARQRLTADLAAAGARSPALLFESAKSKLQFADDGEMTNAAAIVEMLRTQYPEQFRSSKAASIDGGAGRSVPAPLTREALRKMKPAEIAKLDWAVVRRVLSEK